MNDEIGQYLDGVRAALADLSPQVRDELLEDLPEHLADVAADGTGSLHSRLGSPTAYAAELRAAAGVGAPAGGGLPETFTAVLGQLRDRLRALDAMSGPVLGYPRLSDFGRLLRPGWWVLRGYIVGMLFLGVISGNQGVLPTIEGLLVVAVAVVASVRFGRRTDTLPALARPAVTAVGLFLGFIMVINLDVVDSRWERSRDWDVGYNSVYPSDPSMKPSADPSPPVGRSPSVAAIPSPSVAPSAAVTPSPSLAASLSVAPSPGR
jgi:hypothetical protein